MTAARVPVVAVSYGGNNPAEAVAPLDWGAAIPLWHILGHAPGLPAVIVSPARDLPASEHVHAGTAIVDAAAGLGRRIAFVASADQGHGHSAEGRYGLHPESAVFDGRIATIVRSGRLEDLVAIDVAEVDAALADSWWQMLMLHGALLAGGAPYDCEVLAHEAPTYYGMLTALVTPRP
jgi:aromatic ring-opening dioxygenase LigB subunit